MYEQIASNKRRSLLMLAGFSILLVVVVWAVDVLLGSPASAGVIIAIAVLMAALSAFLSWWKSDAIALAASHAHPADPETYSRYHNVVEGLCIAAGLPKPRLYVINDPAPNAFATGRNPEHAAIAVTTGLLEKMNRSELEGVLAHELSHVQNYDILTMTLAITLVGAIVLVTDFALRALWFSGGRRERYDDRDRSGLSLFLIPALVLMILAPILAKMLQFAVSRRRESLADFSAVRLTRYPPGLISALEKLRDDTTVVHAKSRAMAHVWIESPLDRGSDGPGPNGSSSDERGPAGGKGIRLNRLFDTHPPLEERIEALKEL